ncbi:MAG: antibiotic biosynthesis monooxygenase [Anaerolineae bacterium]
MSGVLEVATLKVYPGQEAAYEAAFRDASPIIASTKGYRRHELRRCVEKPGKYLLLVEWDTLEDHTIGFRTSAAYQDWKRLLHPFYEPGPLVEHYESV